MPLTLGAQIKPWTRSTIKIPITILIKLPAENTLNFVINLDFLSCFSSGSTNAPGIENDKATKNKIKSKVWV